MIDIRQSPQFANFMKDIGWKVEKINSTYIYLRKFPLLGYFAKISRPNPPINFDQIITFKKTARIFKLKIAPNILTTHNNYKFYHDLIIHHGFQIETSPYNPTTTIQIDLTQTEENIFKNFTEAKRRAVRRAIKNSIIVKDSKDINGFIEVRKKQYFPLGFLVTSEMKKLWQNFYPKNASLLLAYTPSQTLPPSHMQAIASIGDNKPLAGILLLYSENVAYYWFASSLKIGKKLFAPTLLVWEAIKLAKKRGCKILDFEGIYDERFPKASESWKGFTKFKEGFGGERVVYLENFAR